MFLSSFFQLRILVTAIEPASIISPEVINIMAQGGVSILTILAITYLLKLIIQLVTSSIESVTRLITNLLRWVVRLVEVLVSYKSKDK
jgi:hypothetical protein